MDGTPTSACNSTQYHSCRHRLESAGKWKRGPKWDEGVDGGEKEDRSDFRDGNVGDKGLDEREESGLRKGSIKLIEFIEEIPVGSAREGFRENLL